MKLKFIIILLIAAITGMVAPGCVETVPDGANPAEYNICREHPLGHDSPMGSAQVQGAQTMPVQTAEEIAAECGTLGVMEVPEGADTSQYRKCRDHPLGHDIDLATPNGNSPPASLQKRTCWWGPGDHGCSNGWCWSLCGGGLTGKWCWLAINNGHGEWARCSANSQCKMDLDGLECGGRCTCA